MKLPSQRVVDETPSEKSYTPLTTKIPTYSEKSTSLATRRKRREAPARGTHRFENSLVKAHASDFPRTRRGREEKSSSSSESPREPVPALDVRYIARGEEKEARRAQRSDAEEDGEKGPEKERQERKTHE